MSVQRLLQNTILFLFFSFQEQQQIEFNVINNTEFDFEEVNVYSQKLKNLKPKDSTSYRLFLFDELTHNKMISLTAKDKRFHLYISSPKLKKSTIIIDSLNFKNRIIYYSVLIK